MNRKVLITGATGDTGRAAARESIKRGLKVRAMVHRKDDRSVALEEQGAEVVEGDLLDIDTIFEAMDGIDAAYLVYPVAPGLINATVNFAQAAKEAGVAAVINLSQRSADRHSKSDSCRDTFIAEQVLNWSGLAVTHLRPTYFLEWLLYPWQLPLFVEKGIIRLPVGKGKHAPIGAEDQGRVIAAILQDPERARGPDLSALRAGRDGPRADGGGAHRGARPQDRLRGRPHRRLLPLDRGDGGAGLHRPASRRARWRPTRTASWAG